MGVRHLWVLALALGAAACAPAPGPAGEDSGSIAAGANEAAARLQNSPRHGEWVMVPAGPSDSVRAWISYPERSGPAPVVLVVHEIYGLTGWIRSVADQLAADGFIAIAPDMLSGLGVASDAAGDPGREAAVAAVRALDADRVHRRLRAVAEWGMELPSASDSYGMVGFCWGGAVSFAHATRYPDLGAAVVYYGTSPDTAALTRVRAPVLGLYGADDARVNATVPPAAAVMSRLGKTFQAHTYAGAGHGFLRQQGDRDGANLAASRQAWPATVRWFRRYLRPGG